MVDEIGFSSAQFYITPSDSERMWAPPILTPFSEVSTNLAPPSPFCYITRCRTFKNDKTGLLKIDIVHNKLQKYLMSLFLRELLICVKDGFKKELDNSSPPH